MEAPVLRFVKLGLGVFWGAVVLFLLASAAGENPVRPPEPLRMAQLSFLPEGWSFFTRDPKESKAIVYRETAEGLAPLTFANTSARSLFGVSRAARAFDAELAELLTPVLPTSWRPCSGAAAACAAGAPAIELMNWSTTQFICGDVVVARRPPVPWAWSRSRARLEMDGDVLRLRVACDHGHTLARR